MKSIVILKLPFPGERPLVCSAKKAMFPWMMEGTAMPLSKLTKHPRKWNPLAWPNIISS